MDYLKVGTISAMRGLKGEVKVKSFTNMQAERFIVGNKLYVLENNKYIPFEIESYRVIKNSDFLSFKGYEDINKIEKYQGYDLYMESDYYIDLEENEFFVDELIGLKVYQFNQHKGIVKDIVTYPQGDYLIIETEDGARLVPFRDEFIEEQSDEKIVIVDMEGLL
ncbi:MAG: ribosome maturation factor RimM [Candidatus Izemoplasmatales bacterium]|nr:ribosome maturation factor RimM [Candidatus Izemoplasmatales bacterium]